jgi:hypothetical protein
MKLIPPIGPAKKLRYKNPSPETEKLYLESVKATIATYRAFLEELRMGRELDLKDADYERVLLQSLTNMVWRTKRIPSGCGNWRRTILPA